MKTRTLAIGCLVAILALSQSAPAGVIDTRPGDGSNGAVIGTGADTFGGTFFMDAPLLESFTLAVGPNGSTAGAFRAIVLATSGGSPVGPLLWESVDIGVPAALSDLLFNPGLALSVGSEYFIGVDTGIFTTTAGANFTISLRTDDPIPGQFLRNTDGGGFSAQANADIASRIVMTAAVPGPATLVLLAVGLAGLGLAARRLKLMV
jgi:hypothetical protein